MSEFSSDAVFHDGSRIPIKNIYCVGRNYAAHANELQNPIPKEPLFFQKSTASIAQTGTIEIPSNSDIHYEVELVVCIGADINEPGNADITSNLAGFTIGLDLTDRTAQSILKKERKPWFWAKSFKNSTVLGLFQECTIDKKITGFGLKKNEELVQLGNPDHMLFSIEFLLQKLAIRVPLLRGDILFTGTPSGVGSLRSGDHLDILLGNEFFYSVDIR